MKTYLGRRGAVLILSIFSLGSLAGQSASDGRLASVENKHPYFAVNTTLSTAENDRAAKEWIRSKNSKMFANFSNRFKNAANINVSVEGRETYIFFYVGGIQHRISYNKNGNWLYTIRYYDAQELTKEKQRRINKEYPGYTIFNYVAEVNFKNIKATLVLIENRNSWKRIRITENDMDVYEAFEKP